MTTSTSDYYTAVQRILSRITTTTLHDFSKLQKDSERVKFALSLDFIHQAFQIKQSVHAKSATESKKLRDEGNSKYQSLRYQEACYLYSKGVVIAPVPTRNSQPISEQSGDSSDEVNGMSKDSDDSDINNGKKAEKFKGNEFTLALANRSAALFQLKKYQLAIGDIKLALEYGYPKELVYKLYERMGKCLVQMGKHQDALRSFEKVKEALTNAKLDDKKRQTWAQASDSMIQQCEMALEEIRTNKENRKSEEKQDITLPTITNERNKRFKSASALFDIKFAPGFGRHAVAKNTIKVGDILLIEKPHVCVLSPECYHTHCHHCMKRLEAPVGCFQCSLVQYCCDECRDTSWENYHRYECCYLKTIQEAGVGFVGHLAWRTVISTGLEKLTTLRNKFRKLTRMDSTETIQENTQLPILVDSHGVYMGGFETLYTLLPHSANRNPHDLLQNTILAIYLLNILQHSGFFTELGLTENSHSVAKDNNMVIYVGGMLLRFLQIISCNGVEVKETHVGVNIQKATQDILGLSLYPTASLINHSCNPAMILVFYQNTCIARAMRNIPAGEELSIAYGYTYDLIPKAQRQVSLSSQYFFECKCDACKLNWPIKTKLPSGIPTVRCKDCGGPMGLRSVSDSSNPTEVACRSCGVLQKPVEILDMFQDHSYMFEKALDAARNDDFKSALPTLEEHLTLIEKNLMLPTKDYVTCLTTIKQCYMVMGNVDKKATLL